MNTLESDTLAAIQQLATVSEQPLTRSRYELLEEFYTRRFETQYSPLLAREYYRDDLWAEIKQDDRLLILFRWMFVPLSGRSPALQLDSEITVLRALLAEILSSPESELPVLRQKAAKVLTWLDREGILNGI